VGPGNARTDRCTDLVARGMSTGLAVPSPGWNPVHGEHAEAVTTEIAETCMPRASVSSTLTLATLLTAAEGAQVTARLPPANNSAFEAVGL
jgi:hypothetical protein